MIHIQIQGVKINSEQRVGGHFAWKVATNGVHHLSVTITGKD